MPREIGRQAQSVPAGAAAAAPASPFGDGRRRLGSRSGDHRRMKTGTATSAEVGIRNTEMSNQNEFSWQDAMRSGQTLFSQMLEDALAQIYPAKLTVFLIELLQLTCFESLFCCWCMFLFN